MIEWVATSRLPRWPWWAVAIVGAWGAVVAAAIFVAPMAGENGYRHAPNPDGHREGEPVPIFPVKGEGLCMFRRVTGLPCPTCGASRGVVDMVHGRVVQGWLHNPLLFTLFAVFAAYLAIRLATGRGVRWSSSPRQQVLAWVVGAVAMAANWAYLIVVDR